MFYCVQSSAQQALVGTINTSMQAVQKAQIDLGEVDNLPPLGQDIVLYLLIVLDDVFNCAGWLAQCGPCLGFQGVDPEQDG